MPYRFKVQEVNDAGVSEQSPLSAEYTPDQAPLAPAAQLVGYGDGELSLTWSHPEWADPSNPGSAMTQDLGWILTLGCTLYKLTPGEALRAVTLGAARALGREDLGRLRVGQTAQLTLFDAPDLAAIPYHAGASLVEGVVWRGQFVYWTESDEL